MAVGALAGRFLVNYSPRIEPSNLGGLRERGLPPEVLRACARHGVPPSRFVLVVHIARQTTALFEKGRGPAGAPSGYTLRKSFRCSTSKFGIGERAGSNRTPRGLHRVAEKIGGGWPAGTAFKARQPAGFTWRGNPAATITSRILWLEGLEPGLNRAGRVDSHSRFIYIHGTGNEPALGRPDSHGCIHLAAHDLIPLYDKIPPATLVWLSET
ncbi:MAG TPA: L,D-transpeptidase [Candidatus Acidoferrum sp.]|nr:L,D-transpeptidase [Candidatus Acidoferrum sp.]